MSTAADVARVEWHAERHRVESTGPEPEDDRPDPSEYADDEIDWQHR